MSQTGYQKSEFCLKQGRKISVLNRVRVLGAALHLPIQGYIEYPPPPGGKTLR